MMETTGDTLCPRCGDARLSIYFSEGTDDKLGVLCQTCNLRAYFLGGELVPINA
jgi:transcription elongation factor Elf1